MIDLIHHPKCMDPQKLGCRCPASWPRLPKDVKVKHVRGGNCWVGVRDGDACPDHDEPRGECTECQECPACDAGFEATRTLLLAAKNGRS